MPRPKRTAAQEATYHENEKRRKAEKWQCTDCEKPGCSGGFVSQSVWRDHRNWTEAQAQRKKNREGVDDLLAGYPRPRELDPVVDMANNDNDSEPEHDRMEALPTDSDDDIFDALHQPPNGDQSDEDPEVYGPQEHRSPAQRTHICMHTHVHTLTPAL